MNLENAVLSEERSSARMKYREYRTALKIHKQRYIVELAGIYWQLAHGRRVIDVSKAMIDVGPNVKGEPKLAIARADMLKGRFTLSSGDLSFPLGYGVQSSRSQTLCFPVPWPDRSYKWGTAPVPLIPPNYLPLSAKGDPADLANYHILWEVEKWDSTPPDDPLLLRHLDGVFFVIIAAWDLTPAEKAVMRQAFRP
jgi:hypothetical protein